MIQEAPVILRLIRGFLQERNFSLAFERVWNVEIRGKHCTSNPQLENSSVIKDKQELPQWKPNLSWYPSHKAPGRIKSSITYSPVQPIEKTYWYGKGTVMHCYPSISGLVNFLLLIFVLRSITLSLQLWVRENVKWIFNSLVWAFS